LAKGNKSIACDLPDRQTNPAIPLSSDRQGNALEAREESSQSVLKACQAANIIVPLPSRPHPA
jgi:hypothetical protein